MAQPAPTRRSASDAPIGDPLAVRRAYRLQRARRRARVDRQRENRLATLRFLVVVTALLAATVFVRVTAWQQIERLFGL